jgi:lysophospholipase
MAAGGVGKLEPFSFRSADGHFALSAVRIPATHPKGIIVVVGGRSESWLKYRSLFRDLHSAGYTVYSYDHRGQGLSPHLVRDHPQIGHIDDFREYSRDLGALITEVRRREGGRSVNLIGHSMGAAVIAEYLADHPDHGIRKAVLVAPMFRINTSPWPEPLGRLVLALLQCAGRGSAYAPGEHDALPDEPFARNRVTSSREHWRETLTFRREHPGAVTGGASVDWVAQALARSSAIRKKARSLCPETLILQAGHDDMVIPWIPPALDGKHSPSVICFPDARHEILNEKDPIRSSALGAILEFLDERQAIHLDHPTGNSHSSGTTSPYP